MIWIVMGKMFTNQTFTKNTAVVSKWKNGTNMWKDISAEIYFVKKSIRYEMRHLVQIAYMYSKFPLNFENHNSLSKNGFCKYAIKNC